VAELEEEFVAVDNAYFLNEASLLPVSREFFFLKKGNKKRGGLVKAIP